jgi:hypothetical protein
MNFKCRYCSRTFSNRSGLTQHVNFCIPPESSSDESTDVNDMSLDSEGFSNASEVKLIK